jgi:putative transposase
MARIARIVVPGVSHHVIQRGNRRQRTFFCEDDYERYLRVLKEESDEHGVDILAYCLVPNHVHHIVIPARENSLARTFGIAHERYTKGINGREDWTGYLWQGRFKSYPMDERHLFHAVRYVVRNPVAAGLVTRCEDWRFSSARGHLGLSPDPLIQPAGLDGFVDDWAQYLATPTASEIRKAILKHERTGRPLGSARFVAELERRTGRRLTPAKRGPKTRRG